MGPYRINSLLYKGFISEEIIDKLESASERLSAAVAEKLGELVLPREDPTYEEQVAVYRYTTTVSWSQIDETNVDVVAAIAKEVTEIALRFPVGTKARPLRLAFVVPPNVDAPWVPNDKTEVSIVSMVVWVPPTKG